MAETRDLDLDFVVDGHDGLSPAEFLDLFRCAEDVVRYLTEQEAYNLFDFLELPSELKLSAGQRLHRMARRAPIPAEVRSITRGSWHVLVTLSSAALLYFLKSYVDPVVHEAWDGSFLRQRIVEFLHDRAFQGAKRDVESKAIQSPRYGNLRMVRVREKPIAGHSNPAVEIRLEKQQLVEPRANDERVIDEFIDRLGQ